MSNWELHMKFQYVSFFFFNSTDNQAMLWDIRTSKGCLMKFDQHNGEGSSNTKDSKHT